MHYQVAPHAEAKLVRCTKGAIYDVVIDLRPSSPTFLQHVGVELTADNHRAPYIPEGGGSLRIYAKHQEDESKPIEARARELLRRELDRGFDRMETYADFGEKVKATKRRLLAFLIDAKNAGRTVVGYGAPGKGNTLLSYCGIRTDFIDYIVDRNPYKHGRFAPGTHIPIFAPDKISETRPDYVLVLPWNVKDEIIAQMAHIRSWGGQFVVPIPDVTIV
jgi:hypothetical protein